MSRDNIPDGAYRIVLNTFVKSADENYITARWCHFNGLATDFSWLAAHCIEKYVKSCLLLNGISVKNQSHKITSLFSELEKLCDGRLFLQFQNSVIGDDCVWRNQSPDQFIVEIENFGSPDARYLENGRVTHWDSILKLDQLVFQLRRMACNLFETGFIPHEPEKTKLDCLNEYIEYRDNLNQPIDRIIANKNHRLRNILLNYNTPFAPSGYKHSPPDLLSVGDNSIYIDEVFAPPSVR